MNGDRGGIAGLSAFGLGGFTSRADAPEARAEPDGDARFAMCGLAGALGGVYVASGITLIDRLPAMAGALLTIGVIQAVWSTTAYRGSRQALAVGLIINVLLPISWLLSRTVGLPPGGSRLPVGVLDALCAADSVVIVALALGAWLRTRSHRPPAPEPAPSPRRPRAGAASQLAILLAVLTVSALLGGHTHTAQARAPGASSPGHLHFYCRLL